MIKVLTLQNGTVTHIKYFQKKLSLTIVFVYERTEVNLDYALSALNFCVHNDGIKAKLYVKFNEILYYLGQVYIPELTELKRQSRTYYQKWLNLKDKDKSTAAAVYLEYVCSD